MLSSALSSIQILNMKKKREARRHNSLDSAFCKEHPSLL